MHGCPLVLDRRHTVEMFGNPVFPPRTLFRVKLSVRFRIHDFFTTLYNRSCHV